MASQDEANKLGWFLLGISLGAIVALLFAPKSGRELREDIADATQRGLDRATEGYESVRDRTREAAVRSRQKASDLIGQTKDEISRQKDRLSAALDAGKAAYMEEKGKAEAVTLEE